MSYILYSLFKMSYHPDSHGKNKNVELGMSNYPKKAYLEGATGVAISNIATKSDLARLKAAKASKLLIN